MRKECTLNVLKKAMKNNDYSYDIYFRMAIIDEYLNGKMQTNFNNTQRNDEP